ncbi:MAG: hypothetical protein HC888_09675, partial [Candidatus Competibacteraceae bacterium]|nr:hypothetical protein [Candidatus Competibacteraceae bacterium]
MLFSTTSISNSTLSGNSANISGGGGIANSYGGTVSVSNSMLSANFTNGDGGGILNSGTVSVTSSTLSSNSANVFGGSIYNDLFSTVSVSNSTLSSNSASFGGGIYNGGTLNVSNSTLSGNSASFGGGIYNDGMVDLASTIVADNTASTNPDLANGVAATTNASNSLIEMDGDQINGTNSNNIFDQDPMLSSLQDNGGPTFTQALLPGSPAIDRGSNLDSLSFDQRGIGFARIVGLQADIGAFEIQTPPTNLVVDTLADESNGNLAVGDISLREALAAIAPGVTITFAEGLAGGTITLNGSELVINQALTINGDVDGDGTADITISGNNTSRVFNINDGDALNTASVNLSALTITGGSINGSGGGIFNNENLT